jgi:acetyl esterase/lipase
MPASSALARADDAPAPAPVPTVKMDVWPEGRVPGEPSGVGAKTEQPIKPDDQKPIRRITNVTVPTISVFKAPSGNDTGAAVVIAPGGGYHILAWDYEGEEVAAWLNTIGVTGIVLEYRVPRRPNDPKDEPPVGPLQDIQRALSLVRSRASEWGLDPHRIGVLGFSAGGNLSARAALMSDQRAYEAIDKADAESCKPDFAVLIYPAYLEKDGALKPEYKVDKATPPMFLAHAADDPIRPENSLAMAAALSRAGVPVELHVYSKGGHGFGLRPSDDPCSTWPDRCAAWMKRSGFLDAGKAH